MDKQTSSLKIILVNLGQSKLNKKKKMKSDRGQWMETCMLCEWKTLIATMIKFNKRTVIENLKNQIKLDKAKENHVKKWCRLKTSNQNLDEKKKWKRQKCRFREEYLLPMAIWKYINFLAINI